MYLETYFGSSFVLTLSIKVLFHYTNYDPKLTLQHLVAHTWSNCYLVFLQFHQLYGLYLTTDMTIAELDLTITTNCLFSKS